MIAQARDAAAQGADSSSGRKARCPSTRRRRKLGLGDLARETGAHLATGYVVYRRRAAQRGHRHRPAGRVPGCLRQRSPSHVRRRNERDARNVPGVRHVPRHARHHHLLRPRLHRHGAQTGAAGAHLIAVPSNDWSAITYKHYPHVVFRAVENRVAMIKADGSYDSAIIDPYGRIVALATSRRAAPPPSSPTWPSARPKPPPFCWATGSAGSRWQGWRSSRSAVGGSTRERVDR